MPLAMGTIQVDGGGMFGIVPYVFWSKTFPPDETNRITIPLTGVLVRSPEYTVLVDPGGGELIEDEYRYQENRSLGSLLDEAGVKPDEITHIVFTHLHTDHIAGAFDEAGKLPFPNAQVVVNQVELDQALSPSPRARGDYQTDLIKAIAGHEKVYPVDGVFEVAPGMVVIPTPGHTKGHMSVRWKTSDGDLLFPADLIPTSSHVRLPYVAAFDLYPQETCDTKKLYLDEIDSHHEMVFYHDPEVTVARLESGEKGWDVVPVDR